MLAVRRGGVDSVRQLVASMFLMETQVADVAVLVIVVLVTVMTMIVTIVLRPGQCLVYLCDHSGNLAEVSK